MTPQEKFENLCVNAAGEENARRERHGDEEFDLVMQPSAIIQEPDGGDQSSARHDAGALRARRAVERKQNRQHHPAVHGEAAEQRNRLEMHLARSGEVDHADAQRECAHRHRQHQ